MSNPFSQSVPPRPTAQEKSRQDFVVDLRRYTTGTIGGKVVDVFKSDVEPKYVAKNGRKPETLQEARQLMNQHDYYRFWSALQRNSQEMVWDSVIDTTERSLDELKSLLSEPSRLGTLRTDPDFEVPRYHQVYDIHLQPGGYHTEQSENDVAAGAIYDLGVPIYSMRSMGRENDSTGLTLVNAYQTLYPDAEPKRILDLGCAIGNSTLPWAQAFGEAEVHGIDVAAPCLRYGHLRANSYGKSLHLSQQNAESTDFPDNHFDVVVSALLFHETSKTAVPNVFAECQRILKPGGVMIHLDGFDLSKPEPIQEVMAFWEVYNNNECFLLTLQNIDVVGMCQGLGFDDVRYETMPFVATAPKRKSNAKNDYMSESGFGSIDVLVAQKPAT